jgi:hypothetical protein
LVSHSGGKNIDAGSLKKMPKRAHEPKKEEATGSWKKLHKWLLFITIRTIKSRKDEIS